MSVGQYTREGELRDDGTAARVWQRRPIDLTASIPIQEGSIDPIRLFANEVGVEAVGVRG